MVFGPPEIINLWGSGRPWRPQKLFQKAGGFAPNLLTGTEKYWLTPGDYKYLDKALGKQLKAMIRGKACVRTDTGEVVKSLTTFEVFAYWDVAPSCIELACRRLRWLRDTVRHQKDHGMIIAALMGQML